MPVVGRAGRERYRPERAYADSGQRRDFVLCPEEGDDAPKNVVRCGSKQAGLGPHVVRPRADRAHDLGATRLYAAI